MFKEIAIENVKYILHTFVDTVQIIRPPLKQTAIIWIASELDLWIESVSDLKNSG